MADGFEASVANGVKGRCSSIISAHIVCVAMDKVTRGSPGGHTEPKIIFLVVLESLTLFCASADGMGEGSKAGWSFTLLNVGVGRYLISPPVSFILETP